MTDSPIKRSIAYAHQHHEQFLERFKELLRFPSIGADPAYKEDVRHAAEWIAAEMDRIGIKNAQVIPTDGQPAVYGEWLEAGEGAPTILMYAHYDVQPVDPLDLWVTPPFEPDVREDRIYARGSIDNKCGVIVNLQAFESVLQAVGSLPVNLKFIFEGEEESGSPSMLPFVRKHKDLLAADLLVSCDGGTDGDTPEMFTSLRGIISAQVTVTGPIKDLHSGSYGGVVHNPVHMVARIIAAMHNENGHIQIPGYYDDVRPLSAEQLAYLKTLEETIVEKAVKDTGREVFWGEPDFSFLERQTARPTFDVNGVFGGYQGAGGKTIIPAKAGFKCTMRLVADQDPYDIARKFTDFVQSFACDTLEIDVKVSSRNWPVESRFDSPEIEAVQRAFEVTWGKRARLYRQGGSIGIMGMFQRELGLPIVNLGYGNGGNGHAPNEFFRLPYYYTGIDTAIHFFHYIAEAL